MRLPCRNLCPPMTGEDFYRTVPQNCSSAKGGQAILWGFAPLRGARNDGLYMISEPAIGSAFFGREDVLSTLEKRVNALKAGYRQNVALTGQMLAGKSSILYQFLYNLKDSSIIPIYVEVSGDSFASFSDKFIATLLYNYLISCGREAAKDLKDLIKTAEQFIPHTINAIKEVTGEISKKNYSDAYKELLNLTSILKKETGKSCIVILDEFHNLEYLKIKNPYLYFGKIIMLQKDTMYIVSSSQKSAIRKILSEKLALLYGNFEVIEISGFDNKTSRSFLEEKLQDIALPQNYADYLIDFTDGNPFYLNVIANKLKEFANSEHLDLVDDRVISEAFASLIYNTSGTISQYFTNTIMDLIEKNLRKDYMDTLIALACGFNKLKDIARRFNKKSGQDTSKKLSRLIELDMVYKNGVFYELEDKLFKFWLRTAYHKKKISLVDNIVDNANDFKKEIKNDIYEFQQESQKSVLERVKELFTLFNGETVEIERKKRHLPRFVKMEAQRYGDLDDLAAFTETDKYWVWEICRNRVDEAAILDLIERYQPLRDKVAKKICLALDGIDRNAVLVAKEKNIWVWGRGHINALLRLYKKRNLICQ